jgi:hypothetical protein
MSYDRSFTSSNAGQCYHDSEVVEGGHAGGLLDFNLSNYKNEINHHFFL